MNSASWPTLCLRMLAGLFVVAVGGCGDGGGITVTPNVAGLRFVAQPADVGLGEVFTVQVELVNNSGSRVASADDEVTLSVSGSSTLNGDVAVPASNGLATFGGLSLSDPATGIRITASSGPHTVQSETFSVLEACQLLLGSLAPGQNVSGSLGQDDCLMNEIYPDLPASFVDRWELNLDSRTNVRLELSTGSFDAFLFVANTQGTVLAFNNNLRGEDAIDTDARISQAFPAGDYIVLATSNLVGGTGSYQLRVEELGPCEVQTSFIFTGQSRGASLTEEDCENQPGQLLDYWYLSLTAPTVFRATLSSSAFTPFLGAQEVGATHQISGLVNSGSVDQEHLLATGDYWLFASAAAPGQDPPLTGSYTLTVSEPLDEPQDGCLGSHTAVTNGSIAIANITLDDCGAGETPDRNLDSYQFRLLAGETMSIAASADFEGQFQVDSDGLVVESLRNVPANTPRTIEVTALDPAFYEFFILPETSGVTGEYEVSFSREGAATAPFVPAGGIDTLEGALQRHLQDPGER